MRHRRHPVHQRLGQRVEKWRHRFGRVLLRPDVAPHNPADLAQMDLLGERRRRRDGVEGEEAVQLARGAGRKSR